MPLLLMQPVGCLDGKLLLKSKIELDEKKRYKLNRCLSQSIGWSLYTVGKDAQETHPLSLPNCCPLLSLIEPLYIITTMVSA